MVVVRIRRVAQRHFTPCNSVFHAAWGAFDAHEPPTTANLGFRIVQNVYMVLRTFSNKSTTQLVPVPGEPPRSKGL